MRATIIKLSMCLLSGSAGLAVIFWSLESANLREMRATRAGEEADAPFSVYLVLLAGLTLLNVGVFFALSVWSRVLRANPETRQVPVWVLVAVIVVAGGAGLADFAIHAGEMRTASVLPDEPLAGYVAFQTAAATIVIAALVIMGVRWAPGHKRPREH